MLVLAGFDYESLSVLICDLCGAQIMEGAIIVDNIVHLGRGQMRAIVKQTVALTVKLNMYRMTENDAADFSTVCS